MQGPIALILSRTFLSTFLSYLLNVLYLQLILDLRIGVTMMVLKNLRPAVTKFWLIVFSGLMWSGAGVVLCRLAYNWLVIINKSMAITLGLLSLGMALAAYHFGFSKIARKNIGRLCQLTEKTCLFAFQTWKGYLVIAVMMALGAFMRSSPIPRPWLAILYATIGGALLLASFLYYSLLWQMLVRRDLSNDQNGFLKRVE